MRYALLSDVHANAAALGGVLEAIARERVDRIICLGDITGIHTSPGECIDLLLDFGVTCIAGNHDEGVRGTLGPRRFPPGYWRAILWTRENLAPRQMAFLRNLPVYDLIDGHFLIMHGMFGRTFRYLTGPFRIRYTALRMHLAGIRHAAYGHTHSHACHRVTPVTLPVNVESLYPGSAVGMAAPGCYLFNPGTVGHPRPGDPRAMYALFDSGTRTIGWHAVAYDHGSVLARTKSILSGCSLSHGFVE